MLLIFYTTCVTATNGIYSIGYLGTRYYTDIVFTTYTWHKDHEDLENVIYGNKQNCNSMYWKNNFHDLNDIWTIIWIHNLT